MKSENLQLNNVLPAPPLTNYLDSTVEQLIDVAWELLAEMSSPVAPFLCVASAVRAIDNGNERYLFDYAGQLVEFLLPIAAERASELPNIDDAQYDATQIDVMTLEIAFEYIEAAGDPKDNSSEALLIRDKAEKLSWQKEAEEKQEDIEQDSYIEVVNWHWNHR